jgi:HD-GYP domain-containing protein (c-di-GMP phosphodiesterase class II)
MDLFENKRKTVITLRWLLIIALSYLLIFQKKDSGPGNPSQSLFDLLILFYIASNVILIFLPKKVFDFRKFDLALIVADTAMVSSGIFLLQNVSSYLMFFYFIIILMTTFGHGLKGIVANGFLLIGMYVLFQIKESGLTHLLSDAGELLPIPFLMVAVIFYGLLVDQENRRHKRTVEAIRKISEVISTTLNVREVYQTILDALVRLLGAEKCSIMLLDKSGDVLTIQDARGISQEVILTTRLSLGEGIAGWVAKEGQPLLLSTPTLTAPDGKQLGTAPDVQSAITVPLKIRNRIIGVLNISNCSGSRHYNRQDLSILTLFASEAATAIENARLFEQIQVKSLELKAANLDTIMAFAGSLESKDVYTGGHAQRLSIYAGMIAKDLQFGEEEIEQVKYAAALHDVGKIGIPDHILLSTKKLEAEEWQIMQTHSEKGEGLIHQIQSLKHLALYVRHHHERWDGGGYPDKIKGEQIHRYSRIISVCDTYDAITTNRSYQKAKEPELVIKILKECRGTQLDPELIDLFMGIVVKTDGLFTLSVPRPDEVANGSGQYKLQPLTLPLRS